MKRTSKSRQMTKQSTVISKQEPNEARVLNADRTFTNVDDGVLVRQISSAMQRVVFIAPGLRKPIAEALAAAFQRLTGKVTVILDVDAEVCRLGYGDDKGLEFIKRAAEQAGTSVLHQPGVRIGLLIVDDNTIVYSPVPLLIEAGSEQPDKPNAIVLSGAVPAAIEVACGLSAGGDRLRQVGKDNLNTAAVEAVKADLKANPPKEFNIARIERVFNSALHFVELKIQHYRLQTKKVTLNAELFALADHYLEERIENTFRPFDDAALLTVAIPKLLADGSEVPNETETFGPDVIDLERERLKKTFLFDVPRFGVVIRRANKNEFEEQLKLLEQKLKLYATAVKETIKGHLDKAKDQLKKSLAERLSQNPPAVWKKYLDRDTISKEEAEQLITHQLDKSFAPIGSDFQPEIRWIYKDVTYETIHNGEFRTALEKQFGKERAAKLFVEYDAAPEK